MSWAGRGAEGGPLGERAACHSGTVLTPTRHVGGWPGICFIAQLPNGPWGRRVKACLGASRITEGRPGFVQSSHTREREPSRA